MLIIQAQLMMVMKMGKEARESVDGFEVLDEGFPAEVYGEELNQGHGMFLGNRIKLAMPEMVQLKEIVDAEINADYMALEPAVFDANPANITNLRITAANGKLKGIAVAIEEVGKELLVKVGPCDLSGVGGHMVRQQIIKDVVNQALVAKGYSLAEHNFENVNVSACVGVRGRLQMFQGMFFNNRETAGHHMNAYVKTSNETGLTHWEPRKGPQRFFNDTICAMVTSTTTSLFEKGIRENTIHSSQQATDNILRSPKLLEIFDNLLARTKERISDLVEGIKEMVTLSLAK